MIERKRREGRGRERWLASEVLKKKREGALISNAGTVETTCLIISEY